MGHSFKKAITGILAVAAVFIFYHINFSSSDFRQITSCKKNTIMESAPVELIAAGDIMTGRGVAKYCARKNDLNYPFHEIKKYIQSDIFIGNLEGLLTTKEHIGINPYKLASHPDFAPFLKFSRYTVFSLANNHSFDCGSNGLDECLKSLSDNNIYSTGVATKYEDLINGITLTVKNINFKIFAFNTVKNSDQGIIERCGKYYRIEPHRKAYEAIKEAREKSDFIIVIIHWGEEYRQTPGAKQIKEADNLIKAGTDVIIGAHPHVLQKMEIRNHKNRKRVIIYSAGNFLFDQYKRPETQTSEIYKIIFTKEKILNVAKVRIRNTGGRILIDN